MNLQIGTHYWFGHLDARWPAPLRFRVFAMASPGHHQFLKPSDLQRRRGCNARRQELHHKSAIGASSETLGAALEVTNVSRAHAQAAYQGLVANLATFCAKGKKARACGKLGLGLELQAFLGVSFEDSCPAQGSEGSKLPRIFIDEREVSFDFAVASFLTEDMWTALQWRSWFG